MNASGATDEAVIDGRRVFSRITRRLIPYLFLLYILAYLDRVNVGFAALDMKRDLRLSDTVYGTGAGIFFLGSALFDLPSNLMLLKVGARRWIARIMLSWGFVAGAMAFVHGPVSFYVLRFLLGVAEAGFFPGMILYLTYWYPSRERARAISRFMIATSLAGVVGGPLSSALLQLEGRLGLHGWQWLFLIEGSLTLLVGLSVLRVLRDGPDDARWLADDDKLWLQRELEADRASGGASGHHRVADAFRLPVVWLLAGVYFVSQVGVYTVNLWMPLILHSVDPASSAARVARWAALPYLAAAVFTIIVGWSSDRLRERRGHVAFCFVLGSGGFALAGLAHSFPVALFAFTLAAMGMWSMMGAFWTLPTRMLGGQAAAGGVALITIVGGFGGFLGPWLTGCMRDLTNGFAGGLYTIGGLCVLAGLCCFLLQGSSREASAPVN